MKSKRIDNLENRMTTAENNIDFINEDLKEVNIRLKQQECSHRNLNFERPDRCHFEFSYRKI